MTRAKMYPGKAVYNANMGGRKMHKIGSYYRYGKEYGIYSDAFDIFVNDLAKRIKLNQQNVIAIEGPTGSGKSTFAILLAYALAKKLKVPFSLEKDFVYSAEDMWKKILNKDASPINLIDEAVLVVNAKRSQTKESVDIVNLFNTMRSLGWTTIMCSPSIFQIDKTVRVVHVDYLVRCTAEGASIKKGYGRGFFEVYKAKHAGFAKSAEPYWELKCTGVYGALPPKIDVEYQPIKLKAQRKLIERMAERYGVESDDDTEGATP